MPITPVPTTRFPWWVVAGGLLLSLAYLPTLAAPFDFIDDGNLVYPVPEPTLAGQVSVWWDRVVANVEHLGPFRPVLHAQWQLQANLFDGDPLAWRASRLAWCALSAVMLLWLLRELGAHPVAALVVAGAAMANPYRGEIWRSLTLQEGVAMPYALLALVAARKAADSRRPWRWDAAATIGLLLALGCKNVFVALVPAMVVLRSANGFRWRTVLYLLPVAMPAVHFLYFKLNWKPGQYEMGGPSWGQLGRLANGLKGGVAADFLGAGVACVLGCVSFLNPSPLAERGEGESGSGSQESPSPPTPLPQGRGGLRTAILAALALLFAGVAVYLPLNLDMSGRYTMPAVWGLDILFALLLTRVLAIPDSRLTRAAWVVLAGGLVAVLVASFGRQDRDIARSRLLWDVVEHLEKTAPSGERIGWVGGDSAAGELNTEEGIHLSWHLLHRGRGDIRIGLYDTSGTPVNRVELPPLDAPPRFRVTAGSPGDPAAWELSRAFTQPYRLGRKRFECRLEASKVPPTTVSHQPRMPTELPPDGRGFAFDARTAAFMRDAFTNPGGESAAFDGLLPRGTNPTDLLIGLTPDGHRKSP